MRGALPFNGYLAIYLQPPNTHPTTDEADVSLKRLILFVELLVSSCEAIAFRYGFKPLPVISLCGLPCAPDALPWIILDLTMSPDIMRPALLCPPPLTHPETLKFNI